MDKKLLAKDWSDKKIAISSYFFVFLTYWTGIGWFHQKHELAYRDDFRTVFASLS